MTALWNEFNINCGAAAADVIIAVYSSYVHAFNNDTTCEVVIGECIHKMDLSTSGPFSLLRLVKAALGLGYPPRDVIITHLCANFDWGLIKPPHACTDHSESWWRHEIETFTASLALCAGNSPVTDEFPTQRPVTRRFDVFLHLRLNKQLIEAGALRRHRAHYDVIVMCQRNAQRLCVMLLFASASVYSVDLWGIITNMDSLQSHHRHVSTCPVKFGMQLLIHF